MKSINFLTEFETLNGVKAKRIWQSPHQYIYKYIYIYIYIYKSKKILLKAFLPTPVKLGPGSKEGSPLKLMYAIGSVWINNSLY